MLPDFLVNFFINHQNSLWIFTVVIELSLTVFLYRVFGKMGLYGMIIVDIMLANLQGPKLTVIFGLQTSLGLILYSGIYFSAKLLCEKYGRREAQRAVLMGFTTNVVMIVTMTISLMFLPSIRPEVREFAEGIHDSLDLLFNFTPRFVAASLLTYLLSQSFNVWIFDYLRHKMQGKHLWLRNILSTLSSQLIDVTLYSLIMWWAIMDLSTAITLTSMRYIFKIIMTLMDTPFIYWASSWDVSKKDWFYQEDIEFSGEHKNL
jgi:uncharacterized integral membrane protein (TIGR00697 family)